MLYYIILAFFISSTILSIIFYNFSKPVLCFISLIASLILGIIVFVSTCMIVDTYIISYNEDLIEAQITRDELVWELENLTDNPNFDSSRLYERIAEWNKELIVGKEHRKNIWINIFWSPVYDLFEPIELEKG